MQWTDEGLVLSSRRHGENNAVATLLTAHHGRHAGLVRGGFGRTRRGVLQPGNEITAEWRGRLPEHLGTFGVEMIAARAARVLGDGKRLAGLTAACAMAETALPEREPHPSVYDGLRILLDALEGDDSWPMVYVRWEVGLLGELGFGLDLGRCAATGADSDLVYVSPRTGRAISAAAGAKYRDKLLRLPPFLARGSGGRPAGDSSMDVRDGLDLCAFFFQRHVFATIRNQLPAARVRLRDFFVF